MKPWFFLALLTLFTCTTFAGVDLSNQFKLGNKAASDKKIIFDKGSGAANPAFKWDNAAGKLKFSNDGSTYSEFGSGSGSGGGGINLLTGYNEKFELADPPSSWTKSGSGTFAAQTSGSGLLFDTQSGAWNASAANEYLSSTAVAIPNGLLGSNGAFYCYFQTAATDYKIQATDGTNVLNEVTIPASTYAIRVGSTFIFPASGNVQLKIKSASDAAVLYVDNCYIGSPDPYLSNVSQATIVASGYIAATGSCNWTRSNSSLGAVGSVSACPGPTVESNDGPGTLQTTDTNLPQFTVTNLPPGRYEVTMQVAFNVSGSTTGGVAINDGTTTSGIQSVNSAISVSASNAAIIGYFNYTTAGDRTFSLWAYNSNAAATTIYNTPDYSSLRFSIKRFPTSSQLAVTPDLQGGSWSGYHDNTCTFSLAVAAANDFANFGNDASCGFGSYQASSLGTVVSATSSGNNIPAVVVTPKKTGRKWVCATPQFSASGAVYAYARIFDTTNSVLIADKAFTIPASHYANPSICGIWNATNLNPTTLSLQAAGTMSVTLYAGPDATTRAGASVIWNIFDIDQNIVAPILQNQVTTKRSAPQRIVRGRVAAAGGVSSPGTGDWSAVNNSAGYYTITFSPAFPSADYQCRAASEEDSVMWSCENSTITSASSFSVRCGHVFDKTSNNMRFGFICIGDN